MTTWYREGLVALTAGSDLVAGVGTEWVDNVLPGGIFFTPAGLVEVERVISDTSLKLVTPYGGATVAGAEYSIAPTQGYVVALAKQLNGVLGDFGELKDAWQDGTLVGKGVALKGVKNGIEDLPPTGNAQGDAWMVDGHLHVWTGSAWLDQGATVSTPELEALRDAAGTSAGLAIGSALAAEETRKDYEDRVYPGVYSTPPTNKPHSGAPCADGDRCVVLVGSVPYEHIRIGGGWLIPNVDAAQLALGSGGQRVGFVAAGAFSIKNTVAGKLVEAGYSVLDAMTDAERADVLGKFGLLDVSAAIAKAFGQSLSVYFPEGRYFAPTVKWPQRARPRGAGRGLAVVVGTAAANGEILATSSVIVRGITFDTWNAPLLSTQSVLDGLDVSECEFVNCKKSVADRAGTTRTIDASKVIKNFTYWDNIDRDGEKAISICCLLQVADVQHNVVRRMAHPTQATCYTLGSEDGTDTVYDSFSVVCENNDFDDIKSTGLNAETHAIMAMAKNSSISKNTVRNVRNTNAASVNGTEGIYVKGPGTVVLNNDLLDAGLGQGAICLKNKNAGDIKANGNRIRYVTVPPLTGANFLTGIWVSEVGGASVDLSDNQIFGAQRPIAVPTEPGPLPQRISIKRNYGEGDLYAGVFVTAAKILEIEDNTARQTNPSLSGTSIGVFTTANAAAVEVMSIKNNKSIDVHRAVVVAYSGTASIALLRLKGNDCGVNVAIPGNRGLTYSGNIAALDLGDNDLSMPTTKVVGTPPATFFCRSNPGFKTGNGGAATVLPGSTVIDVAHGLAIRPRGQDISVRPANALGLATKFFVSNITDNFFRITVNSAPGGEGAIFDWVVRAYEA